MSGYPIGPGPEDDVIEQAYDTAQSMRSVHETCSRLENSRDEVIAEMFALLDARCEDVVKVSKMRECRDKYQRVREELFGCVTKE